jgi:hypothetical protein
VCPAGSPSSRTSPELMETCELSKTRHRLYLLSVGIALTDMPARTNAKREGRRSEECITSRAKVGWEALWTRLWRDCALYTNSHMLRHPTCATAASGRSARAPQHCHGVHTPLAVGLGECDALKGDASGYTKRQSCREEKCMVFRCC